ncbi:MAG TPA: hypothetical protein VM029_21010 [Opitutaceae bacterium]|nr:hypothetical protein [Opitutaceae bacterium]
MKAQPALILPAIALLAASVWLLSRVVIGLDFTDEMQYYGEIASLTRTGKFFQDDLFIQQLGYLFLLPFFKLHAAIFPDLSYLLIFGRLLMVAGYIVVGCVYWRAASRLGDFSTAAKLTGLAAFVAWIPFQIFAPGYNSMSYLLLVCVVGVWITRGHGSFERYALCVSPLLAALTVVYPPAGVIGIAFVTVEAARRDGWARAFRLLVTIVLCGGIAGGLMIAVHGPTFIRDLLTALGFSRLFRIGYAASEPDQLAGGIALLLASAMFLWRVRRGRPFAYPLGARTGPALRWGTLALLVVVAIKLLLLSGNWASGYFSTAGFIVILMLLASSVDPAPDATPPGKGLPRWILLGALAAGGAMLLAMSMKWATGYFATSVHMLLLLGLCVAMRREDTRPVLDLVMMATVLSTVFAFTSGNGLHNFGMGAAVVIPFLLLYVARQLHELRLAPLPLPLRHAAPPAIVALLLLNAGSYPYREQLGWDALERVRGVPAFSGIWTSFVKTDAVKLFRRLAPRGELQGRRLLVAGPHPWAYFAFGAEPATPMFFMHFTGGDTVHEMLAERLFLHGPPDAILITNTMPPPIHAKIVQWIEQGCTAQKAALPPWFTQRYHELLRYELADEILLLRREPKKP